MCAAYRRAPAPAVGAWFCDSDEIQSGLFWASVPFSKDSNCPMRQAEKRDFVPRFVPRFALCYPCHPLHPAPAVGVMLNPVCWCRW